MVSIGSALRDPSEATAMSLTEPMDTIHLSALAILGGLVLLSYAYGLLKGVYARCLRGGKNLKKYGSWAVVTGATDGIGKAMAFEFARKGLNVVLISRSEDKLQACAEELKAKHSVEVKTLAVDYGRFDAATRTTVDFFLKDLDIGILVNNVGISYPFTKYFHELSDENVTQLISLNVDSTTWMTRIVLPGMLSRKRGSIVNIGSAAGVSTSPLLAQYGAAKAYVSMFSKAMNAELRSKNIHVQCQVPMFVATKLAKIKRASLFVASPAGYARAAAAAIGYETVVSPFWSHALQIWLLTNLPEWVMIMVTANMHGSIRKAGMRKEAKKEAEAAGGEGKKKA
mmetsp:Transcript_896/g.1988  ORF Transcript_896/g.1988 Transcript_896/m.1988 type:complete len:341 (+) Transcript_896:3-1025(+)